VGGITPAELAAIRGRLEGFADDILASLARKDQRARGECYLPEGLIGPQPVARKGPGRIPQPLSPLRRNLRLHLLRGGRRGMPHATPTTTLALAWPCSR
jgi:hypothetical protein